MTELDDVKKRHRIGYKILDIVDIEKGIFRSPIMNSNYHMNQWYDAGDPSLLTLERANKASPKGKIDYRAGIHYYHDIPEHELTCVAEGPIRKAIVKFKLKGVIETGMEGGVFAGVTRMACPISVVDGAMEVLKVEKQNLKALIEVTDGQVYLDIFKNRTPDSPTDKELKKVFCEATKSRENYIKFITFIDHFERKHPLFIFYTNIHLALNKRPDEKHDSYNKYYSDMVTLESKTQLIKMNLTRMCKQKSIGNISGPVA